MNFLVRRQRKIAHRISLRFKFKLILLTNYLKSNIRWLQIAKSFLDLAWFFRALRPRQCEIWILYSTSHVRLCSAFARQVPSCNLYPLYWGLRISQTMIDRELPQAQRLSLNSYVKTILYLCISPFNSVRLRLPYQSDFNLGPFSEVMLSGAQLHTVVYYDDGPVTFLREALCRRMFLPPILFDFVCWKHPYDRSSSIIKRQVPLNNFIKLAVNSYSVYPSATPERLRHLIFMEAKFMNFPQAFTVLESFSETGKSFYDFMLSPHLSKNWVSAPSELLLARSTYELAEDHIIDSPSSQVIVVSALSSTVLVVLELLRQGLCQKYIRFFICLDPSKCQDSASLGELHEFVELIDIRYSQWASCFLQATDANSVETIYNV